jgi:hypothetical protein
MLTPFERTLLHLDDPARGKPSADDLMAMLNEPSGEQRDWDRLSRIMSDPNAVAALRASIEAQTLAKELRVRTDTQPELASPPILRAAASPMETAASNDKLPRSKPKLALWISVGSLAAAACLAMVLLINRDAASNRSFAGRNPTSIERLEDSSQDLEQFVAQGSWKLRDLEGLGDVAAVSSQGWLSEPSLANEAIYRNQEFKWTDSTAKVELWDATDAKQIETDQSGNSVRAKSQLTANHYYEVRLTDDSGTRIARFRALSDSEERLIATAKEGKGSIDTCARALVIAGRFDDARAFLETHAEQLGEQTKGIVRAAYLKRGKATGLSR